MISKKGKAHWDYYCDPCGVTLCSVDRFGAEENKLSHERSLEHLTHPFVNAFQRLGVALMDMFKAFNEAAADMEKHLPKEWKNG